MREKVMFGLKVPKLSIYYGGGGYDMKTEKGVQRTRYSPQGSALSVPLISFTQCQ